MTVKVTKPSINVREELADLRKPTGIAGEAMLRAETPQEQFNLIGAGRRNIIINGDMRIDQRNNGAAVTGHATSLFGVDRFRAIENHSGSISCQRVADAPEGFEYSNKITTTGTDTSLSATEYSRLVAPIEGNNISHLNLGSSNAKTCTLSFWVKSSLTGTFCISIFNAAANRSMVKEYTIAAANVWEYKTIEVIGDTTGTWLTTNSAGIYISWSLGTGTAYQTSTLNSYQAGFKMASSSQVNLVGTASATWQITGVQLELGKVATPFEHRSYGEELALCQRYYVQYDLGSYQRLVATSYCDVNNRTQVDISLPVPLRSYVSAGHTNLTINGQAVNGINLTQTGSNGNILSGNLSCPGTPLTVGAIYQVYAIGAGNFYVNGEL